MGGYKFVVKETGTNQLVIFMDTSRQTESFYMILFASSAIAVICWLILLVIVILLSGKVIRPVLVGMEKQKQFITNAGHEMKTPLAIIQSNNDTMALIHGENKYNAHIRTQTKRLNVLMSNLLTLAKLDEEIPLPTEWVNISEVTNELLPVYQESARIRNLQFNVRIEPDITLRINKESFGQMLTILLDNAVKYHRTTDLFIFPLQKPEDISKSLRKIPAIHPLSRIRSGCLNGFTVEIPHELRIRIPPDTGSDCPPLEQCVRASGED